MNSYLTLGAIGALLSASACTQTPANPLAEESGFCLEKAKAECQVTTICAIEPALCLNTRMSLCTAEGAAATMSGVRTYVSANAQACIDALTAAYANNNPVIPFAQLEGPGSITDKCNRVFSGSVAVNGTCDSDYDCTNNRICSPLTPGSTARVCADAIAPNVDGFCANPGSTCPVDMYCAAAMGGAAQCTAAAETGAPCGNGVPCVSAAQCVGTVCEPREGPGGGCSTDDQCGPMDPYCDLNAGGICTIGLTFATGSDDCRAYLPGADASSQTVTANPTVEAGASDATIPEDAADVFAE